MDFSLTEEQRAIQAMARDFAAQEMAPHAAEWDAECVFPIETLRAAASLGLAGILVGEEHGGSALGRMESAIIFEELSAGCTSTAAFLSIHNMVSWMIDCFGDDDMRVRLLPKMMTMETVASYCLTEPGSGSDAAALKTRAAPDNQDYTLNGSKAFISGGGVSDIYAVMARTGGGGPSGISCILVENGAPGLSFGAQEKKMGWRSQPTSAVIFEDCKTPIANRLGAEGEGFKIAMQGLDGGRINIASCSIGTARTALETATAYMKERKQFGRRLADFQALQFRLADMATELDAARLMTHRAAASLDAGDADATMHCAMAKRFATDVGFRVCNEALQLHGGYGYLQDFPLERHVRDVRVHQILEGTNEIMRLIVARKLLEFMSGMKEVLLERRGALGLITLNRPQALNALTLDMIHAMTGRLAEWAGDPAVSAVLIRGAGEKAFCAGGDIRALIQPDNAAYITGFFADEYRLNRLIFRYPKPYIALLDGIVMGGGVGVSVNGAFRIATGATLFAMPETGIGMYPDVGGSYFLPRCPGKTGMYLGLTGARLRAADCLYTGIADVQVGAESYGALIARLEAGEAAELVLRDLAVPPGPAPLAEHRDAIDRCFSGASVEDIVAALDAEGGDWAAQTLEVLKAKSPLALKVAFRQLREGRELDFEACMAMEYRLSQRVVPGHDFREGVRAVVIDKDRMPQWRPETLAAVGDDMIAACFAPLGDKELTFAEDR